MPQTPTRRWQRKHRRTALWIGGLLLAFQLLIGLLVETALPSVRDPDFHERLAKLRELRAGETGKPFWLFLGSSRTGNGIDAKRFTKAAAFNLGVPASGPVTQAVLWKRLVADGQVPDRLFVEILPAQWNATARHLEPRMLDGARLTYGELAFARRHLVPTADLWKKWSLARLFPAYRHQAELRDNVGLDVSDYYPARPDTPALDAHGWQAVDAPADKLEAIKQLAHRQYDAYYADFAPLPGAAEALKFLLADAEGRGVKTTLLLMPEGSEFRTLWTSKAEAGLQALLKATGKPVIDARDWVPDDGFYDMHHTRPAGAKAFTERLAQEIPQQAR